MRRAARAWLFAARSSSRRGGRPGGRGAPPDPPLATGGSERGLRPRGTRLAGALEAALTPAVGGREARGPAALRGKRQARRSLRATVPRIEEASVADATPP